jgi:hypothetical protein
VDYTFTLIFCTHQTPLLPRHKALLRSTQPGPNYADFPLNTETIPTFAAALYAVTPERQDIRHKDESKSLGIDIAKIPSYRESIVVLTKSSIMANYSKG